METKPFWCTASGQTSPNGQELAVASVSQVTRQNYQAAKKRMTELQNQAKSGCILSGISTFSGIMLFVLAIAAIPVLLTSGIVGLLEVAACGGLVYGILFLISRSEAKKEQQLKATPAYQQAEAWMHQVTAQVNAELGLPQNTVAVDVLSFPYCVDGTTVRNTNIQAGRPKYTNVSMRMYADNGMLYLISNGTKYGFSLACLQNISTANTPIAITGWNKWPTKPDAFGITQADDEDTNAGYHVDAGFHVLSFQIENTYWSIYIPAYELSTFQSWISNR